ncbi:MAG TPA: GNAT family N-acetyltransferase [Ktedonobacterales bacterium]|jgi:GNAT superfamily N-acetyltransferase
MAAQTSGESIRVRPYTTPDRDAVLALGERLVIGLAPWRDPAKMRDAARRWIEGDIARIGETCAVLVAEEATGQILGFVAVAHEVHFTGDEQAYVGELVVARHAEGHGAGRALMSAAEEWARARGYRFVTLDTGAANVGARAFYARLGYAEESVKLVKPL